MQLRLTSLQPNLVDVVQCRQFIEAAVHLVQHVDNVGRLHGSCYVRECHDVAEQYRHLLEFLCAGQHENTAFISHKTQPVFEN